MCSLRILTVHTGRRCRSTRRFDARELRRATTSGRPCRSHNSSRRGDHHSCTQHATGADCRTGGTRAESCGAPRDSSTHWRQSVHRPAVSIIDEHFVCEVTKQYRYLCGELLATQPHVLRRGYTVNNLHCMQYTATNKALFLLISVSIRCLGV